MIIIEQHLNEGIYLTTASGEKIYIEISNIEKGAVELTIDTPLPVTTVDKPVALEA